MPLRSPSLSLAALARCHSVHPPYRSLRSLDATPFTLPIARSARSRSLRSLVDAPCRLPATASGAASGLAALGSSALPSAIASRPHYALIGWAQPVGIAHIVYRLPP